VAPRPRAAHSRRSAATRRLRVPHAPALPPPSPPLPPPTPFPHPPCRRRKRTLPLSTSAENGDEAFRDFFPTACHVVRRPGHFLWEGAAREVRHAGARRALPNNIAAAAGRE